MIWLIVLSVVVFSFVFALLACKCLCGNMDKEYYDEIELANEETTQEEIDEILLFGTSEEETDYEEEV